MNLNFEQYLLPVLLFFLVQNNEKKIVVIFVFELPVVVYSCLNNFILYASG
jgi:hypothetical protein